MRSGEDNTNEVSSTGFEAQRCSQIIIPYTNCQIQLHAYIKHIDQGLRLLFRRTMQTIMRIVGLRFHNYIYRIYRLNNQRDLLSY